MERQRTEGRIPASEKVPVRQGRHTPAQRRLAGWLRSIGLPDVEAAKIVKRDHDIPDESVRFLTAVPNAGSLVQYPLRPEPFVRDVRHRHRHGDPIGAWMGFGISANRPPLYQPIDIVRDWMFLRNWYEKHPQEVQVDGRPMRIRGVRVMAVLDDYLAPTYNHIDPAKVYAHVDEKRRIFEVLNRMFGGEVEVMTVAAVRGSNYQAWNEVREIVGKRVLDDENSRGHKKRLLRVIPPEIHASRGPEAIWYGIDEVVATIILAQGKFNMPVKVGHLGETDYDMVSVGIGIDNPFKITITGLHLVNPPSFEPVRARDEEKKHEIIPRGVSYRAPDPSTRLTVHDNATAIRRKLAQADGNQHVREHWSVILGALRGVRATTDSQLRKELAALLADIRREAGIK